MTNNNPHINKSNNNNNNNNDDYGSMLDDIIEIELSSPSSTSNPSATGRSGSGNRKYQVNGIIGGSGIRRNSSWKPISKRKSRPPLHRSNGIRNITLIDEIVQESRKSGIIGQDYTSLTDLNFYIHWLLTFGPIGIGVVLYWRGMWLLLDEYLYPGDENFVYTAWSSLSLGLLTGVVCHVISCKIQALPTNITSCGDDKDGRRDFITKSSMQYSILERLYSFLVGFGVVNYWRGVWYLWDAYVLTSNPVVQNWISLLVGCTILFALRAFRSVFAPPMVFLPDDADDIDGLTLELCDNVWWDNAAITVNRRSFLKESHFVRVANLITNKMKTTQTKVKQMCTTATVSAPTSTTTVHNGPCTVNNSGDPASRQSSTSISSGSVDDASNGGDIENAEHCWQRLHNL